MNVVSTGGEDKKAEEKAEAEAAAEKRKKPANQGWVLRSSLADSDMKQSTQLQNLD